MCLSACAYRQNRIKEMKENDHTHIFHSHKTNHQKTNWSSFPRSLWICKYYTCHGQENSYSKIYIRHTVWIEREIYICHSKFWSIFNFLIKCFHSKLKLYHSRSYFHPPTLSLFYTLAKCVHVFKPHPICTHSHTHKANKFHFNLPLFCIVLVFFFLVQVCCS